MAPHRGGHGRGLHAHDQGVPVVAEHRGGDDVAGRDVGGGLAGGEVEQVELAAAGDVPDQRGERAVLGQREPLELGVLALGEHLGVHGAGVGRDVDGHQRRPLPPAVGEHEHAGAALDEAAGDDRRVPGDRHRVLHGAGRAAGAASGVDPVPALGAVEVDDPDVARAPPPAAQQRPAPVGGHVEDLQRVPGAEALTLLRVDVDQPRRRRLAVGLRDRDDRAGVGPAVERDRAAVAVADPADGPEVGPVGPHDEHRRALAALGGGLHGEPGPVGGPAHDRDEVGPGVERPLVTGRAAVQAHLGVPVAVPDERDDRAVRGRAG